MISGPCTVNCNSIRHTKLDIECCARMDVYRCVCSGIPKKNSNPGSFLFLNLHRYSSFFCTTLCNLPKFPNVIIIKVLSKIESFHCPPPPPVDNVSFSGY